MSTIVGYRASGDAWDEMMLRQGLPAELVWVKRGKLARIVRSGVEIARVRMVGPPDSRCYRITDATKRYVGLTQDEAEAVRLAAARDDARIANAVLETA